MKQTLMILIEQIESDMFTGDELIEIIRAIGDHSRSQFSEVDSPLSRLVIALDLVVLDWEDRGRRFDEDTLSLD